MLEPSLFWTDAWAQNPAPINTLALFDSHAEVCPKTHAKSEFNYLVLLPPVFSVGRVLICGRKKKEEGFLSVEIKIISNEEKPEIQLRTNGRTDGRTETDRQTE